MILQFGTYKGHELSSAAVPTEYVRWLALRGSYTEPGNRFKTVWKVPIDVSILARREMERRGYVRNGDWYEKEG